MTVINNNYNWAFALTPRSVTTHLILHHAAASKATADGIHAYHLSKGWAGIAYHYFVTKKGEIYRGRPENTRGGHTTNWNYCSIGICFEGNFDQEEMPKAQMVAGRELVSDIVSRYPSIAIGSHSDYEATACPGKYFPFDEISGRAGIEPEKNAEKDEKPSDWASESCACAVEKGLLHGDENKNFHWHNPVTREELAVILKRASALGSF